MKYIFSLILTFLMVLPGQAQTDGTAKTKSATIQPTIMVIPYTREGVDLRRALDYDANVRVALAKVKEAFDSRGFSTIDFIAKLKETESRQAFNEENQTDLKSQIIEYSGADVYVETEAKLQRSGSGNSVNLIITAYDASTGTSLSNKVGFSPKFHTDDYGRLTAKAVEGVIEDFLNVMQNKFTEIVENGRFVAVEFSFGPDSEFSMETEVGEDELPLSDALELWMEENAFKGYYHIQGTTDVKMIFDQVRIPLKLENGANYTTNKFALQIFKFCRKLQTVDEEKISVKKSIKGNTIFITVK